MNNQPIPKAKPSLNECRNQNEVYEFVESFLLSIEQFENSVDETYEETAKRFEKEAKEKDDPKMFEWSKIMHKANALDCAMEAATCHS